MTTTAASPHATTAAAAVALCLALLSGHYLIANDGVAVVMRWLYHGWSYLLAIICECVYDFASENDHCADFRFSILRISSYGSS